MIETKRLKLREFTEDDVDSLAAIFADHETMKFYPATKDREETVRWIEKNVERYKKYGFGLWAVVRKDNDEFIGDCGITMQNIDGEEKPEIGYHIRRDYWGQGYATEAASACKEHAFNKLGLEEAFSYMRSDNLASRRVAEKIGMTLRKEYINNGYPTVIYSIKKLPI
jgi:RimJ/RimL family protein N-acetyltransferase